MVGGGPTGIEVSAELADLIREDLTRIYPELIRFVQITIYDVAPRILGGFDASLGEYATKKFRRQGINICTGEQHQRNMQKTFYFAYTVDWACSYTGVTVTEVRPQSLVIKDLGEGELYDQQDIGSVN